MNMRKDEADKHEASSQKKDTLSSSLLSEPCSEESTPWMTLVAFAALGVSLFLVALDTVLIPTSLPTISLSFHIDDTIYAWIGSSYLLANAVSIPCWGKLSDIFGRKSVLQSANIVFLVGSILCAVSLDAKMLVIGRTVQGLGGGGVVVLVHVCVSDLFNIRDRSFYLGILGGIWAVASALGPVLGGMFAQRLSWRWCFYINLPIISSSIVVGFFALQFHNPRTDSLVGLASMDWLGILTILCATLLFLVGLQLGNSASYTSPLVITMIVLGVLAFITFPLTQWWAAKRKRSPIMPLHIFRNLNNISALAVCACDALVFNSIAYFLPLYFQIVLDKTPSMAGVLMLAIAIPLATISFISGHIIEQTGRFLEVLQCGLVFMTVGIGLLISLKLPPDLGRIIGFLLVIGIGFGPNFGAPLIALQTQIEEKDIATGTAVFGFIRMVSAAVGINVGQVVFQATLKPEYHNFIEANLAADFARVLISGEAVSQASAVKGLTNPQQIVIRKGFASALRSMWILYTVVSAVGLCVSFGIKRARLHREPPNSIPGCTMKETISLELSKE
ncbi:hypothetical protein ACN47E_004233 [Coniothyrium glycines]